jgi:uncharacterized protein
VSKPPTPTARRARPSALALTTLGVVLALGLGVLYLALSYRAAPPAPPEVVVALPPPPPPASNGLVAPALGQTLAPVPGQLPPPAAPSQPLAPAPDPALVAGSAFGPLPVIAPDGRQAWRVYARPPAVGPRKPRVAILLAGLGLSASQTQAAIQLPGEISLGFLPHAPSLGPKLAEARAAGHEVLLHLPMEPRNYPNDDPGPHALLTSLTPAANLERLEWSLSRGVGYVGVVNRSGARFAESDTDLRPVLLGLRDRGLMYLDASEAAGRNALKLADQLRVPRTGIDLRIDAEAARGAIDARLAELEQVARQSGQAIGLGEPFPVTIERLGQWAATLPAKGIELAPVSAIPSQPERP